MTPEGIGAPKSGGIDGVCDGVLCKVEYEIGDCAGMDCVRD